MEGGDGVLYEMRIDGCYLGDVSWEGGPNIQIPRLQIWLVCHLEVEEAGVVRDAIVAWGVSEGMALSRLRAKCVSALSIRQERMNNMSTGGNTD